MTGVKKISHSAWLKYNTCPYMYDLHYNKRLRPDEMSSNLVFGSAVDNALLDQHLLYGKDPLEVFKADFTYEKHKDVYFEPKDYQPELFTQDQLDKLKGKDIQYMMWANFRIKGRLLIEAFMTQIKPHITKTIAVQKETNDRPGFIDCIVELDGYDGPILADLKTARRPYKYDQTDHSTQLALYAADQGIDKIAFLVLCKTVKIDKVCSKCGYDGSGRKFKTCNNEINGSRCFGKWDMEAKAPEAQILVADVNTILQKNVQDSISQVETAIEAKQFHKNLNNCGAIYGKPCPYFQHCHKNDDTGLTVVESSVKLNKPKEIK